jgi:hypothetical protein
MVGLLPLCATTVIEPAQRARGNSTAFIRQRLKQMPDILQSIHPTGPGHLGVGERGILALLNPQRLRRILTRMLDEDEFLSPYGIRSLSKYHKDHPYIIEVGGREHRVDYLPAESNSGLFGGTQTGAVPFGSRSTHLSSGPCSAFMNTTATILKLSVPPARAI